MLTKLRNQLRFILRRNKSESDLDREIRFHIEMEAQEMDNSASTDDPRRTALANFGSVAACKEAVRETWGLRLWSDLWRDFQYTFRMIRRKPGFAIIVILTLSLGIGANTAVFSVFDRAVLRPLPYANPEQLVHLWETRSNEEFAQMEASYPNFQDWIVRNHSFTGLAGYNGTNFTLTGFGVPVRISAERVTTNMLSVLGVRPQLGRDFLPSEETLGSHVAIVTHGFWQTQLAGRSDVLGQSLRLNGMPYTIVGVLPADFRFELGGQTSMFVPLEATPDQTERRQFHWLRPIGRLKPNVSVADAEAEMKSIAAGLVAEYPATNTGTSARLVPLQEQVVGNVKPVLLVVFGAAACMLALALVNLANLIVAQSAVRQREMAIRAAIGAGTMRLGRQMVAESLMLALFGGVFSLLVAHWTLTSIFTALPVPLLGTFASAAARSIDTRVTLFNMILTLAAGTLAGGLGAFRVSRSSLNDVVKGGLSSHGNNRLRTLFTTAEVALAVLLLVAAVVMVESVQRLTHVNPGFNADHLISMRLSLPAATYPKSGDVVSFYRELQRRVAAIPGVDKAAVIDELPLTTDGGTVHVYVQGQPQPQPGSEQESVIRSASPDYFETMQISLLKGRTFAPSDESSDRIVVINYTLAKRLFQDADPVGQRIVMPFNKSVWEVVGVVNDVHLANLDRGIRPTVYTCSLQDPSRSSNLVVRTMTDMSSMVAVIRREAQVMDPELPVYAARTMAETINFTSGVATRKLVLYLVGAFSSIGVAMAGIGLYGLLSFSVAQRSKEIGIRVALGAARSSVKRLIFRQAAMMTATGLAIGLVGAILGNRLMQSIVFGVSASNPGVLLTVAVLVGVVTCGACYVPVSRATRIDPIIVLRQD
jgi:putative ABC transport system permease protein